MKYIALLFLYALIMWAMMFAPGQKGTLHFWILMTLATAVLGISSLWLQKKRFALLYRFELNHILIGIVSSIVLYGIFFLGYRISIHIFGFAQHNVQTIYLIRNQANPAIIALLLLFWIAPAEEIFWRGLVQERLSLSLGSPKGYMIATLLYASVHLASGNIMLFMASLICGIVWGWLFMHYKSLWPGIISHALWGVGIFVVAPMQTL